MNHPTTLLDALAPLAKLIAKELAEELKPLLRDGRPEFVERKTCPFSKRWWDRNAGKTFPVSRDGRRLIAKRDDVDRAFERQAKLAPMGVIETDLDDGELELVRAGIRLNKTSSVPKSNPAPASTGKFQSLREINDAINRAFGLDTPLPDDMLKRLRKIHKEEGVDAIKEYFEMTEPPVRRLLDGLSPNVTPRTKKQIAADRAIMGTGLLEYNPMFLRKQKHKP